MDRMNARRQGDRIWTCSPVLHTAAFTCVSVKSRPGRGCIGSQEHDGAPWLRRHQPCCAGCRDRSHQAHGSDATAGRSTAGRTAGGGFAAFSRRAARECSASESHRAGSASRGSIRGIGSSVGSAPADLHCLSISPPPQPQIEFPEGDLRPRAIGISHRPGEVGKHRTMQEQVLSGDVCATLPLAPGIT